MFVCALAQFEEYERWKAGEYGATADAALSIYQVFFLCMLRLNSVETETVQDTILTTSDTLEVTSHESDARDYLEQALEICLYGIVSKHVF